MGMSSKMNSTGYRDTARRSTTTTKFAIVLFCIVVLVDINILSGRSGIIIRTAYAQQEVPDNDKEFPFCYKQETDMFACLKLRVDPYEDDGADQCEKCVANRVPLAPMFCSDLNEAICPAIYETCNTCRGCRNQIEAYVTCSVANVTGCPLQECEEHEADLGDPCRKLKRNTLSCLSDQLNYGKSRRCATCVRNNLPVPQEGNTCSVPEWRLCSAFSECNCGSCEQDVLDYYKCVYRDQVWIRTLKLTLSLP